MEAEKQTRRSYTAAFKLAAINEAESLTINAAALKLLSAPKIITFPFVYDLPAMTKTFQNIVDIF